MADRKKISRCKSSREVVELLAKLVRQNPDMSYTTDTFGPVGISNTSSITIKKGSEIIAYMQVKKNGKDGDFVYTNYTKEVINKTLPKDNEGALASLGLAA